MDKEIKFDMGTLTWEHYLVSGQFPRHVVYFVWFSLKRGNTDAGMEGDAFSTESKKCPGFPYCAAQSEIYLLTSADMVRFNHKG